MFLFSKLKSTMNRFGAFLGCSLVYGMTVETNSHPSIPYFTVENAERRLMSPRYVYPTNENFRVPSAHREVAIIAKEGEQRRLFFVNPEDLLDLAPGLLKRLRTLHRAPNGRICDLGELEVGVVDFELMLRLIFDCFSLEDKDVLDLYLPQMLILARRFKISSLGEECKQHVMNANYAKLSYKRVRSWLEGFKRTNRFDDDNTISLMLSEKLILILGREFSEKLKKLFPNIKNTEREDGPYIAEGINRGYETTDNSKRR